MKETKPDKAFLSLNEFAAAYKMGKATVKDKIETGEIPAIKRVNSFAIPNNYETVIQTRAYLQQLGRKGAIIITNANHKGGVMKTTSTTNLAVSYAFMGMRVLITDMDFQANASMIFEINLANRLREEGLEDPGADEYQNRLAELVEEMDEIVKEKNITNLMLSAGDLTDQELKAKTEDAIINIDHAYFKHGRLDLLPNSIDLFDKPDELRRIPDANTTLSDILGTVKDQYDIILVDTAPYYDTPMIASILCSNYIIVPIRAENYALRGMKSFFPAVYKLNRAYKKLHGHDLAILGSILSGVMPHTNIARRSPEFIEKQLREFTQLNETDSVLFSNYIKHSVKVIESQFDPGGTMLLTFPTHEITYTYLNLALNILAQAIVSELERGA